MLSSVADLKPGDIMDAEGGHVILFAKWLNDENKRAVHESSLYSKVIASPRSIDDLVADGFRSMLQIDRGLKRSHESALAG